MRGSARQNRSLPEIRESCIGLRLDLSGVELMLKFRKSVLGEPQVCGAKLLVEHRRAEKVSELLLLHRVARRRQNVPAAGVDGAGNLSIHGREQGQSTVFKLKLGTATTQFNARTTFNFVYRGWVSVHSIEGRENFARLTGRLLRQDVGAENRTQNCNEEGPGFHAGSVVR